MLQHLRVFSEYDSQSKPVITPLIRIDMWYPKNAGYYGSVRMMKQRLAQQIAQLQAAPQGERAIMLWWLLSYEMYVAGRGADPLAVAENGKVDTRRAKAMLKPFSDEIKRLRIPIDLIYIDNEGGFGLFSLSVAQARRVLRSRRARANMPPEVAALDPADLESSRPGWRNAVAVWERWATKLKLDAIKDVVMESGLFDVRPSRRGAVQRPSVVNFAGVNPAWTIRDFNGWVQSNTSIDGVASCIPSYVGVRHPYLSDGKVHHFAWNDLINWLNHYRSCVGKPGSLVHPILPHPWYSTPWLLEQLIAHVVRMGLNWSMNRCAFLYWNANEPAINDPIMADMMMRNDKAYPMARNLPEIPLDVDQITTVDYTTTYEDFLVNMADFIAANPGG